MKCDIKMELKVFSENEMHSYLKRLSRQITDQTHD